MVGPARPRILSGMRPSGRLHLGHLFGALNNWVKLQDEYECFYMVADWHALTTDYADPAGIPGSTRDMVVDWLTAGIDPERSAVFCQSSVLEHAELFVLLSMITPLGWLYRCPTYKEQLRELSAKDLHTFGFLGYPVLQAADILAYRAAAVPVGEDQLPHLELTREIARRFNGMYGEILPEPRALLAPSARLPGTDARKMSKSYGNAITMDEQPDELRRKIQQMYTDPAKIRAADPGHPDGCVVFAFHRVMSEAHRERAERCSAGALGCASCKKDLFEYLNAFLEPLRVRRAAISADSGRVDAVLRSGAQRAARVAGETLRAVRAALHLGGWPQ